MEQQQTARSSGSLQTICDDQQQAIHKLMSGNGSSAERRARELEDLLTNTGSLAVLGRSVAALVHEIIQPLTATTTYAAGCRHLVRLGRYDELDGVLQQIIDQGDRAAQVANRMRELVGVSDLTDVIAPHVSTD